MPFNRFRTHIPQPIDIKRRYGILMPLVTLDDEWHLLFEKRAHHMRRQPGEICFPGGRIETNESAESAAIRETYEEIGVPPTRIVLYGPMDFLITPFGDCLYPFVGELTINSLEDLALNADEVDSVIAVPVQHLIDFPPESYSIHTTMTAENSFPFARIASGKKYNWHGADYSVLFYEYQKTVIWGMTAKITKRLIDYIK